jgi:hypothetical protein
MFNLLRMSVNDDVSMRFRNLADFILLLKMISFTFQRKKIAIAIVWDYVCQ